MKNELNEWAYEIQLEEVSNFFFFIRIKLNWIFSSAKTNRTIRAGE